MGINFLRLIRFHNLIMVFITQCVVFHVLNSVTVYDYPVSYISVPTFCLLSICTVLIAAAGYVINDIYDIEIDAINKPEKQIVGVHFSKKTSIVIYFTLLALGFILAFYLAYILNKWNLLILFPSASLLLYLYARKLKKSFLIGNILVSLFVAAVPLIIILGMFESFADAYYWNPIISNGIWYYALFGFIANMLREIVKDIEDYDGDKMENAKTLPLVLGKKVAKAVCLILLSIFIFVITSYFIIGSNITNIVFTFAVSTILLFSAFLIYQLIKAKNKKDYNSISTNIKLLMLCGLISLFIWPYFI